MKEYHIKHAGWLLACDSPKNVDKGELELAKLSHTDARAALLYRDECKARDMKFFFPLAIYNQTRRETDA
tara:strand:+ start:783 stop:992 length:210 start_codon:yes stop_codon:yes gene_type:complete